MATLQASSGASAEGAILQRQPPISAVSSLPPVAEQSAPLTGAGFPGVLPAQLTGLSNEALLDAHTQHLAYLQALPHNFARMVQLAANGALGPAAMALCRNYVDALQQSVSGKTPTASSNSEAVTAGGAGNTLPVAAGGSDSSVLAACSNLFSLVSTLSNPFVLNALNSSTGATGTSSQAQATTSLPASAAAQQVLPEAILPAPLKTEPAQDVRLAVKRPFAEVEPDYGNDDSFDRFRAYAIRRQSRDVILQDLAELCALVTWDRAEARHHNFYYYQGKNCSSAATRHPELPQFGVKSTLARSCVACLVLKSAAPAGAGNHQQQMDMGAKRMRAANGAAVPAPHNYFAPSEATPFNWSDKETAQAQALGLIRPLSTASSLANSNQQNQNQNQLHPLRPSTSFSGVEKPSFQEALLLDVGAMRSTPARTSLPSAASVQQRQQQQVPVPAVLEKKHPEYDASALAFPASLSSSSSSSLSLPNGGIHPSAHMQQQQQQSQHHGIPYSTGAGMNTGTGNGNDLHALPMQSPYGGYYVPPSSQHQNIQMQAQMAGAVVGVGYALVPQSHVDEGKSRKVRTETPEMMQLKAQTREALSRLNLNQSALARALNIKQSYISRWLHNKHTPGMEDQIVAPIRDWLNSKAVNGFLPSGAASGNSNGNGAASRQAVYHQSLAAPVQMQSQTQQQQQPSAAMQGYSQHLSQQSAQFMPQASQQYSSSSAPTASSVSSAAALPTRRSPPAFASTPAAARPPALAATSLSSKSSFAGIGSSTGLSPMLLNAAAASALHGLNGHGTMIGTAAKSPATPPSPSPPLSAPVASASTAAAATSSTPSGSLPISRSSSMLAQTYLKNDFLPFRGQPPSSSLVFSTAGSLAPSRTAVSPVPRTLLASRPSPVIALRGNVSARSLSSLSSSSSPASNTNLPQSAIATAASVVGPFSATTAISSSSAAATASSSSPPARLASTVIAPRTVTSSLFTKAM